MISPGSRICSTPGGNEWDILRGNRDTLHIEWLYSVGVGEHQ